MKCLTLYSIHSNNDHVFKAILFKIGIICTFVKIINFATTKKQQAKTTNKEAKTTNKQAKTKTKQKQQKQTKNINKNANKKPKQ